MLPLGLQEVAQAAGLLHDIGKYSDAFQRRLLRAAGEPTTHSWGSGGVSPKNGGSCLAVAGHHGGLPDGEAGWMAPTPPPFGPGQTFCGALGQWERRSAPNWWADRNPEGQFHRRLFTRMLYSCLVDADYLDTETFMNGSPAPRGGSVSIGELLSRLERYIAPWWEPDTDLNRRCAILRQCLTGGSQWERALHPHRAHRRGQDGEFLAFALSMQPKPRDEPGGLCHPLHFHCGSDCNGFLPNPGGGKCPGASLADYAVEEGVPPPRKHWPPKIGMHQWWSPRQCSF